MHRIILFTTTVLVSTSVFALGGLFGGGSKSSNPNGVKSIAVELCGVENCPKFRIIEGNCDGEHTYKEYGTCLCEKGYVSKNGVCEACPEGQYSDGRNECTACGSGTHSVEGSTECVACDDEMFAPGGTDECYECPAHADCTNESFSCKEGFKSIGGSWDTLNCVCKDGTTLSSGDTCVTCESLHRLDGTNGNCGDCKTDYYEEEGGICKEGVYQSSCPENATCNGTDFTCNSGYKKNTTEDGCILIEGSTCSLADNSECGGKNSGYYCAFASPSCTADSSNYLKPSAGSGTCESVSTYRGNTITGVHVAESGASGGAAHTYNTKSMDWWSANAWCVAKGSDGLYDAGCGTSCSWSDVSSAVSGLSGNYWLSIASDSCLAFYVNSSNSAVNSFGRNYADFFNISALCK